VQIVYLKVIVTFWFLTSETGTAAIFR
jgi:hypothetical protein